MLPLGRTAGALLLTALALSGAACESAGPDDPDVASGGPSGAPSAPFSAQPEDFDAVRVVVRERARAIEQGDEEAFLATVDDADPDLVAAQRTLFANLTALPLSSVRYVVADFGNTPADVETGGDPVFAPDVTEHVELREVATGPVGNRADLTFVRRDGAWLVAAEGYDPDQGLEPPQARPWLGEPIDVALRDGVLALTGADGPVGAAELAGTVRSDRAFVADVLAIGDRGFPVLVDATPNGVVDEPDGINPFKAAASLQPLGSLDATGERWTGRVGAAVLINPEQVESLVSNRRLMRHELTHLLLERSSRAAPLWAVEGNAGFVEVRPRRVALPPGRLRGLAELDRLPRNAGFYSDGANSYPWSAAITEALVAQRGVEGFRELLDAYAAADLGLNPDTGTAELLEELYGLTERDVIALAVEVARR